MTFVFWFLVYISMICYLRLYNICFTFVCMIRDFDVKCFSLTFIKGRRSIPFGILHWDARVCKNYCYTKKAASVEQNVRLSASCNFLSFWLIKSWGTTNRISDHAAPTDEFNEHNFTSKIWRLIIKSEHLWVYTKMLSLQPRVEMSKWNDLVEFQSYCSWTKFLA